MDVKDEAAAEAHSDWGHSILVTELSGALPAENNLWPPIFSASNSKIYKRWNVYFKYHSQHFWSWCLKKLQIIMLCSLSHVQIRSDWTTILFMPFQISIITRKYFPVDHYLILNMLEHILPSGNSVRALLLIELKKLECELLTNKQWL